MKLNYLYHLQCFRIGLEKPCKQTVFFACLLLPGEDVLKQRRIKAN